MLFLYEFIAPVGFSIGVFFVSKARIQHLGHRVLLAVLSPILYFPFAGGFIALIASPFLFFAMTRESRHSWEQSEVVEHAAGLLLLAIAAAGILLFRRILRTSSAEPAGRANALHRPVISRSPSPLERPDDFEKIS